MGKMKDALIKLAKKVSGKDVDESTKDSMSNVINFMAENYVGVNVIETSNITGLTTEQCEALNVGDIVVKLTSNQKHTYTVSYKEAGVGMCLTYVDASVSETVSYDYVTDAWVYNSTDVTPLGGGGSENHLYQYFCQFTDGIDDIVYPTFLSTTNYETLTPRQILLELKVRQQVPTSNGYDAIIHEIHIDEQDENNDYFTLSVSDIGTGGTIMATEWNYLSFYKKQLF